LAERMLSKINWSSVQVALELGPGTGSLTERILARMGPNGTLIAIEANAQFAEMLTKKYGDARLKVVRASATRMRQVLRSCGCESADCIVSGLPFANMRAEMRRKILASAKEALKPPGSLVLFHYRKVLPPFLEQQFPLVDSDFELLNVPPAFVF